MLPSEKEALVDLLNAHTNKIIAYMGMNAGDNIPMWKRENVENQLSAAERTFLAEPADAVS